MTHDTASPALAPLAVDPLDHWLHVQPSVEEEAVGRIVLPAAVQQQRVERAIVLAAGPEARGLAAGDLVLVVPAHGITLRDGTRLVQRQHVIARVRED